MKNTKVTLAYASDRKATQKIMPSRTSSSKEECYQGGKVWHLNSASSMRWVRHSAFGLKADICNWNFKTENDSANSEVFQGYVLKGGVEVKEISKHHLVLATTLPNRWASSIRPGTSFSYVDRAQMQSIPDLQLQRKKPLLRPGRKHYIKKSAALYSADWQNLCQDLTW